ncbi:MAG TPA: hypothetical protein VIL74_25140 [Pyrinomonadaceae bacterium]|jgi:hypothetical protein
MERFFQILAVILAGVAAYFLWQGHADRAFAAAVFGAVSFFLSVRVQVKGRLNEREAAREEEEMRRRSEEETEEFEEDVDEIAGSEAPRLKEMSAPEQINNEQRTTNSEPKL